LLKPRRAWPTTPHWPVSQLFVVDALAAGDQEEHYLCSCAIRLDASGDALAANSRRQRVQGLAVVEDLGRHLLVDQMGRPVAEVELSCRLFNLGAAVLAHLPGSLGTESGRYPGKEQLYVPPSNEVHSSREQVCAPFAASHPPYEEQGDFSTADKRRANRQQVGVPCSIVPST